MAGDDDVQPVADEEITGLIDNLIEEAAKEDIPPRLRALARRLEAALDRIALDRK